MGLDSIIRSGVKLADKITKDLQLDVLHEAWTGQNQYAAPTFASGVMRKAIVEKRYGHIYTKDGEQVTTKYRITFIGPIPANGSSNRSEPIDPRDRFTLPDGTTGLILNVGMIADPDTGRPYIYEVDIG